MIILIVTPFLALLLCDYPEDMGLKPYGETQKPEAHSAQAVDQQTTGRGVKYVQAIRMPIFYGLIAFAFLMNATATLNVFVPTYMQKLNYF